jgi:ketosteroid isomerase-like protein
MSRENVQVVQQALDAFSSGDADAFAGLTTPDIEWKTGLGAIEGGEIFHGHEGVHRYFDRLSSAWDEFRFLPNEFRDGGEVVLVLGRLEGRGRGGVPVDSPVGAVWELRAGRIWRLRAYLDHAEATRVAGL